MARRTSVVLAVFWIVAAAPAVAASSRALARQCKQSCGSAIQQCVAGGGRKAKCRRSLLRQCKRNGISVCVPPGELCVSRDGVDATDCGTPASPCRSIQFAIDTLVPPGGAATVKLAAGTYDERSPCLDGAGPSQAVLCVANKQIIVRGGFVPPDWTTPGTDAAATVLDAGRQGRVVRVGHTRPTAPAATLDLEGVTIRNGMADTATQSYPSGGGMLVETAAVVVRNVVFDGNESTGTMQGDGNGERASGGALSVNGADWVTATATLENVRFTNNAARGGAGTTLGGYALGGALFTFTADVTGDGLVFTDNTAVAGASAGAGEANGEKSDALGGAVAVEVGSSVTLTGVQATGNVASGGDASAGEAGGAFGGAFFAEAAVLAVSDSTLSGNRAQGGDGLNTSATGSVAQGGAVATTQSSLTLDRVSVLDNEARSGDGVQNGGIAEGGGVSVILGTRNGVQLPFLLRNTVVAGNLVSLGTGPISGGGGGGIWINGATGSIVYSTLAANRLGDPRLLGNGLGMLPAGNMQTSVAVADSIFADHTTAATAPSLYLDAALWGAQGTAVDLTRVLFANNVHDTNAGVGGGQNPWPATYTQTGVMTAPAAGFVASGAPTHDYRLTAGSPAIDHAGDASVTVDRAGDPRPTGAAPDLGAFERGS